jgi:hypothetical protein
MKVFSSILTVAACICAAGSPVFAQGVTGRYAVTITTDSGACEAKINWTVGIVEGRIEERGLFIRTTGQVNAKGAVTLRVVKGSDTLAASGQLTDEGGNGTWTSPSRDCSGRWQAAKA